MRLLFVCLGNICRSPTAEGAMRHRLAAAGLEEAFELDSAGTGDYHLGEPPDPRAAAAAQERGVELAGRARQVEPDDFARFDLLLAMDERNAADLRALAPDRTARAKVRLLREFDPRADGHEVPDPYLGQDGFASVFTAVDAACAGLLDELRPRG